MDLLIFWNYFQILLSVLWVCGKGSIEKSSRKNITYKYFMCWLLGLTVCLILIPVDTSTQEPQADTYVHKHTFPCRFSQDFVLDSVIFTVESLEWRMHLTKRVTGFLGGEREPSRASLPYKLVVIMSVHYHLLHLYHHGILDLTSNYLLSF